jgi:hypothetical protein
MKKTIALLLITLVTIQTTKAQENGQDEFGSWMMFFGNARLSENISISPEVQYRTYEFGSNFNQLLLRTGVNWHINKSTTASIGYGYISTDGTFSEPTGEQNTLEHRLYGQFTSKNTLGKFKATHRYRFEQRFIDSPISGNDIQYRVRYLLRVSYPIYKNWFVSAYDEVFINLKEPVFSQNRLYAAVGYHLNSNITTQVGYLKNHFTGKNYDRFQIGIWYKIDLRDKKK